MGSVVFFSCLVRNIMNPTCLPCPEVGGTEKVEPCTQLTPIPWAGASCQKLFNFVGFFWSVVFGLICCFLFSVCFCFTKQKAPKIKRRKTLSSSYFTGTVLQRGPMYLWKLTATTCLQNLLWNCCSWSYFKSSVFLYVTHTLFKGIVPCKSVS